MVAIDGAFLWPLQILRPMKSANSKPPSAARSSCTESSRIRPRSGLPLPRFFHHNSPVKSDFVAALLPRRWMNGTPISRPACLPSHPRRLFGCLGLYYLYNGRYAACHEKYRWGHTNAQHGGKGRWFSCFGA